MAEIDDVRESNVERLVLFYSIYAPEKTRADAENNIDRYLAQEDGLEQMWAALTHKYGPEPTIPQQQQQQGSSSPNASSSFVVVDGSGNEVPSESQHERDAQAARLTQYYAKYAPEKTNLDVLSAVERYANGQNGGYAAMWTSLERKYGPENAPVAQQQATPSRGMSQSQVSSSPRASTSKPMTEREKQADRLRRYYDFYVPGKSDEDVAKAINKFDGGASGGFEAMWRMLEGKYGPEANVPRGTSTRSSVAFQKKPMTEREMQADRLRRYYDFYVPGKSEADVTKAINKFDGGAGGGFAAMWRMLEGKYGPEANVPRGSMSCSSELEALSLYYAHYCPEKTEEDVASALDKFAIGEGGFPAMWAYLEGKYGPKDVIFSGTVETQRQRLTRYYEKYCPDKTEDDVTAALKRYGAVKGGYERMWKALVKKYGPEEKLQKQRAAASNDAVAPSERHFALPSVRPTAHLIVTAMEDAEANNGGGDSDDDAVATPPSESDVDGAEEDVDQGEPPLESTTRDSRSRDRSRSPRRLRRPSPKRELRMAPTENPLIANGGAIDNTASFGGRSSIINVNLRVSGVISASALSAEGAVREALRHDLAANFGISVKYVEVMEITGSSTPTLTHSESSIMCRYEVDLPLGDEISLLVDVVVDKVRRRAFKMPRTASWVAGIGGDASRVTGVAMRVTGAVSGNSEGGPGVPRAVPLADAPWAAFNKSDLQDEDFGVAGGASTETAPKEVRFDHDREGTAVAADLDPRFAGAPVPYNRGGAPTTSASLPSLQRSVDVVQALEAELIIAGAATRNSPSPVKDAMPADGYTGGTWPPPRQEHFPARSPDNQGQFQASAPHHAQFNYALPRAMVPHPQNGEAGAMQPSILRQRDPSPGRAPEEDEPPVQGKYLQELWGNLHPTQREGRSLGYVPQQDLASTFFPGASMRKIRRRTNQRRHNLPLEMRELPGLIDSTYVVNESRAWPSDMLDEGMKLTVPPFVTKAREEEEYAFEAQYQGADE